jgi:hypothetical protein
MDVAVSVDCHASRGVELSRHADAVAFAGRAGASERGDLTGSSMQSFR